MAKQQGNKRKGKLFDKSKSSKPFNKTGRKSISKLNSWTVVNDNQEKI